MEWARECTCAAAYAARTAQGIGVVGAAWGIGYGVGAGYGISIGAAYRIGDRARRGVRHGAAARRIGRDVPYTLGRNLIWILFH